MPAVTVIKADRIFDPTDGRGTNKYLLLNKEIIEGISDSLPSGLPVSVIEFPGRVIVPFFCDYHLHFPHSSLDRSGRIAEILLECGINRVFEGGDGHLSGPQMKGLLKGRIEVKTSGYAICRKGSYGKFIGKAVEGFREARVIVDELGVRGADYIKVINSGIFDPESDSITDGGFEREDLVNIVACARACGLDVFCHANGDKAIREAVDAGVSAIIHGLHISNNTLSMMAERNIAFIPTVKAFDGLSALTGSPSAKINIQRAVEGHLSAIKDAAEKGVRVLPGSDSGPQFLPYGKAFHGELALFKKAGLSNEYILSSAVSGRLMPGMKADFLVLKGLDIEKIFIDGKD